MKQASTQCPPADVIAAFALGELKAANATDVQLHVSTCELCLETVGQLAHSSRSAPGAATAAAEPALAEPGQLIGAYRLVQRLGEGGMGEVWKAEQLAPVKRTVALKLLKAGMDTRQIVARFEGERQLLALMQHPGIAQMFDAGITAAGRPYFVMEYVDGTRVTEYCDQAALSVNERLALFQQVCEAVQHAHQKGVIHRDLKPSNILVTVQNGRALPKVIDFGLAKLTAASAPDATLTEVGMVMGTPAYASPEQMSLGVIDVDTRSDVYSLGVVLYELLVGVIPFEIESGKADALIELRQRIRNLEPARPSARFGRLGERGVPIAKARGTDGRGLTRQLRGDLDWITMKALEKDRTRRYTSPGDLARETQRYLADEPVLAGSPTAGYRLRKFVLRHRAGTAFGAVVAVLVIAFIVTTAVQLKRVAAERDRATAEAAKSTAINSFLLDTLGSADPWQTGGKVDLTSSLKQAVVKVDQSFKDQPLTAAAVRNTIGRVYATLGQVDEAGKLFDSALATREKLLGHDSAEVAESLDDRQSMRRSQGKFDEGEKDARAALAIRRKLFGLNDARVADSMANLAEMLTSKGSYPEATQLFEQSLAIHERISGPESLDVARVLSIYSTLIESSSADYAKTEQLLQRSLAIRRKHLAPDDLRVNESIVNLGALYYLEGKNEQAEKLYRQAYALLVKNTGKDAPGTIVVEENLAGALFGLGRYEESLDLMKDVIARRAAVLGEDSPLVARSMVNRAMVLSSAGRVDESVAQFKEAVPHFGKAYGENVQEYAVVLRMYESALNKAKAFPEAEAAGRESLARFEASKTPADHPYFAQARVALASTLLSRDKVAEAQTQMELARPVIVKQGLDNNWGKAFVKNYVEIYKRQGKPKDADAIKAELLASVK
jgi:eukaryotic-like serine/threonine-protein kinase